MISQGCIDSQPSLTAMMTWPWHSTPHAGMFLHVSKACLLKSTQTLHKGAPSSQDICEGVVHQARLEPCCTEERARLGCMLDLVCAATLDWGPSSAA